jgi:hypothetical protein
MVYIIVIQMHWDLSGYHVQAAKTGLALLVAQAYPNWPEGYCEWSGSYTFFHGGPGYMRLPSVEGHKNVQGVKAPGMRYRFVL